MAQVVLDTNIIVSALLWGGAPQRVIAIAVDNDIPIITSEPLIHELAKTLQKPKLGKYISSTGKSPSTLISELVRIMTVVELAAVPTDAVRDPDDVKVLATAVGGNATHIVSGDKDLLDLEKYRDILILSAVDFIKAFEADDSS